MYVNRLPIVDLSKWSYRIFIQFDDPSSHHTFSWPTPSNGVTQSALGFHTEPSTSQTLNCQEVLLDFHADAVFSEYVGRDFNIWTGSYGGHYGTGSTAYFLDQNTVINDGKINGTVINLKSLGVGNGFKLMVGSRFERFCLTVCGSYNNRRLQDALTQYPGYVKYFVENLYNVSIARETTIQTANNSLL